MTANNLTFHEFSTTNRARCGRWHPGFPNDDGWTGADWANAMQGEAGEAGNVVKKLRRVETGRTGVARGGDTPAELRAKLADEIGDVVAYLDLLAQFYGLDLAECVAAKFNAVSEREGMPERLPVSASALTWPVGARGGSCVHGQDGDLVTATVVYRTAGVAEGGDHG